MRHFIFVLIVLIGLLNLVSATMFDIGNDENNLTTFTFNSLTEKIEIINNGAFITNLFHFNINTDALNQNLHFSLNLPYDDGRNLSVSSFEYLACGSQLAHENSIEIHYPENQGWTLDCGKYKPEIINKNLATHVSHSLYLPGIPLGDLEKTMDRIGIYVQVKYSLQNYVVENEGEYEYISIEGFQTSKTYISFDNSRILLIMPASTILEEKSNFDLRKVGKNGEIVLDYRNPKEDSFITFRDSKKQNNRVIVRNYSVIAITFAASILMFFLGRRLDKSSKTFEGLIKSLGLALLVFGVFYISGNYKFAVWGLIATFVLALLIQLYITFSDLKNKPKKNKKK